MKYFYFILGLILFGAVVYSGYYTKQNDGFIVWFGVITALLTPIGFELILTPFRSSDKQALKDIAKVAQFNQLVAEAKDNEAKVELLQKQQKDLSKVVAFESKRRTLEAEREIYLFQAKNAFSNLERINLGIKELTSVEYKLPDELVPLQIQLQKGETNDVEFTIGHKTYVLKSSYFEGLPPYGNLLFELLKVIRKLFRSDSKK